MSSIAVTASARGEESVKKPSILESLSLSNVKAENDDSDDHQRNISDYEKRRLKNIQRNKTLMEQWGIQLPTAAGESAAIFLSQKGPKGQGAGQSKNKHQQNEQGDKRETICGGRPLVRESDRVLALRARALDMDRASESDGGILWKTEGSKMINRLMCKTFTKKKYLGQIIAWARQDCDLTNHFVGLMSPAENSDSAPPLSQGAVGGRCHNADDSREFSGGGMEELSLVNDGKGVEEAEQPDSWVCKRCTLVNKHDESFCDACAAAGPRNGLRPVILKRPQVDVFKVIFSNNHVEVLLEHELQACLLDNSEAQSFLKRQKNALDKYVNLWRQTHLKTTTTKRARVFYRNKTAAETKRQRRNQQLLEKDQKVCLVNQDA